MTFVNNLDPDEALQNTGPRLKSRLYDIQIMYMYMFQKPLGIE